MTDPLTDLWDGTGDYPPEEPSEGDDEWPGLGVVPPDTIVPPDLTATLSEGDDE